MISEVYRAFKEANVSDETAARAAEAVAAYDSRFVSLDAKIDSRFAESDLKIEARFASLDVRIERIEGRMTLLQWMLALLIGGVASLVVKAFA